MDNGLSTAPLLYAGIINRPCRLVNPRPCFCNVFVASYAAGASLAPGAGVSVAEAGASVTEAGASVAGAGVSVVSASAAAPGSASADATVAGAAVASAAGADASGGRSRRLRRRAAAGSAVRYSPISVAKCRAAPGKEPLHPPRSSGSHTRDPETAVPGPTSGGCGP